MLDSVWTIPNESQYKAKGTDSYIDVTGESCGVRIFGQS